MGRGQRARGRRPHAVRAHNGLQVVVYSMEHLGHQIVIRQRATTVEEEGRERPHAKHEALHVDLVHGERLPHRAAPLLTVECDVRGE